ncbi:MAG TPA: LuxR C-terminal-related transcriptional regulator [Ramlibacter sp.]|jgi:DNA-binding CsgD family transcriptional regulator|uniref:helix-turn-helix transcriptional regulator n=1 Tax=Ramlibacter sp. TaxID=1917967 RepID=UPI002D40EE4B|nr:LuxR C-terminal-related transcriptional regulator [Ramlibacter sp.]HZY20650.1 LuxR C-terminal-related transcriptional regulator [Ramlibacter sp.]
MEDQATPVGAAAPAQRTEQRWLQGPALDLVLDEMAYGVAVAGQHGELLHANQAARHELAGRRALSLSQGRLQAQSPADTRILHEALVKACSGRRSLIGLAAGQGSRLTLAVVPVGRAPGVQPVHAALLFARASVCESLMLCFFARSHALTSAEENVLGILCQGYSAPQAARRLNVAVSTVRSHVRSLCAKTRSSGVRELVSRVAMLPPVAPALLGEPVH